MFVEFGKYRVCVCGFLSPNCGSARILVRGESQVLLIVLNLRNIGFMSHLVLSPGSPFGYVDFFFFLTLQDIIHLRNILGGKAGSLPSARHTHSILVCRARQLTPFSSFSYLCCRITLVFLCSPFPSLVHLLQPPLPDSVWQHILAASRSLICISKGSLMTPAKKKRHCAFGISLFSARS